MNDENKILFCTAYYSEMYMPNYPCNIKKLNGRYLQGSSNALAFPMESPYHKVFNHILERIKDFGTWDLITSRMDERRHTVPCSMQYDEIMALGYENIFSVFIMLGIGLGIATSYSFYERFYYELKKQFDRKWTSYPTTIAMDFFNLSDETTSSNRAIFSSTKYRKYLFDTTFHEKTRYEKEQI